MKIDIISMPNLVGICISMKVFKNDLILINLTFYEVF